MIAGGWEQNDAFHADFTQQAGGCDGLVRIVAEEEDIRMPEVGGERLKGGESSIADEEEALTVCPLPADDGGSVGGIRDREVGGRGENGKETGRRCKALRL